MEVRGGGGGAGRRRGGGGAGRGGLPARLAGPRAGGAARQDEVTTAAETRRQAEGQRNSTARRLAELGAAARSARAEADRLPAARANAETAPARAVVGLTAVEARLRAAHATPPEVDPR